MGTRRLSITIPDDLWWEIQPLISDYKLSNTITRLLKTYLNSQRIETPITAIREELETVKKQREELTHKYTELQGRLMAAEMNQKQERDKKTERLVKESQMIKREGILDAMDWN